MSKEATVEQLKAWAEELVREVARDSAEKAWDEGYYIGVRARESADALGHDINPYRLAAKGDGSNE